MLGRAEFALMKPSAYLINIARGPLVDQAALVEALQTRRIAGAGLDVFDKEPLPADESLLKLENVIVTPHWLCSTSDVWRATGQAMAQGMLRAGMARCRKTLSISKFSTDRDSRRNSLAFSRTLNSPLGLKNVHIVRLVVHCSSLDAFVAAGFSLPVGVAMPAQAKACGYGSLSRN